jgi:hypothetical protein
VLPTTSSASWLSSLTGLPVADHRVPGVVFALPEAGGELINVLTYRGPGLEVTGGNVFSDSVRHGYRPVAVLSDLDPFDCSWRDELLRGAETVVGGRFYPVRPHGYRARPAGAVGADVRRAIHEALASYGAAGPCLLWCFVEVDQHIHRHGYDKHVREVLRGLDDLAVGLTAAGALVVAYADHGLVPTHRDEHLTASLDDLQQRFGCAMGGAGRIRWFYPAAEDRADLATALAVAAGGQGRVVDTERMLGSGGLLRERVGPVALVAGGPAFLTEPGYRYDHGSDDPAELHVPFSCWGTPAAAPPGGPR